MLVRATCGAYRPASATVKVPIISPTVVQWTGASPWMDLVQRALTWEAREPDVYVNVYFGFPWSDVPDAGMTIQAITNDDDDAALARRIADDMARYAWRRREALLTLDQGAHDPRWRRTGEAGGGRGRNAGGTGRSQRSLRLCHLAAARNHRTGTVQHADRHHCGCRRDRRAGRCECRRCVRHGDRRTGRSSPRANRCASPAWCGT